MSDDERVVEFRLVNMETISKKLSSGESISGREKLRVMQTIWRTWRFHLSVREFSLVSYVIERTILESKDHFVAPVREMIDGSEDFASIGISRSTYFRICNRLEAIGILFRVPLREGTLIALNLLWNAEWLDHQSSLSSSFNELDEEE